jgi:hypothetical protein
LPTGDRFPDQRHQRKRSCPPPRGFGNAVVSHVWTAPAVQGDFCDERSVRVRSCVRPVCAAAMAAGPDEVRGSDPKSPQRARSAWTPWVCPIPGSTGLSSPLTTPAFPLDRIRPSGTSATWPEPRRIDCGRATPRRSARSCWQAPPIPAWPIFARAAWQPRTCWHCLGVQVGSPRSHR